MIILIVLGLVLGLWESGEAGEGWPTVPAKKEHALTGEWPNKQLRIGDSSGSVLATCNESQTKCWTPCEQKMREAMKLMDMWLKRNIVEQAVTKGSYTYGLIKDQWDATYQECVR